MFLNSSVSKYDDLLRLWPFNSINNELLAQNENKLRPFYLEYVDNVSTANMATSLELATFLYTLCSVGKYSRLLDLGSGFSSFIFRLYATETSGVIVYSVDDDAAWLEKTGAYLNSHGLNTQNMLTMSQFLASNENNFDCVLHDLNFVDVRVNYVHDAVRKACDGGCIIFDDVHKREYLTALLIILRELKMPVFDVKPATVDNFGRYSVLTLKKDVG